MLTKEIAEEIINNLLPEEKTLGFSEFTSTEVSLGYHSLLLIVLKKLQ